MENREIVSTLKKSLKNVEVKETQSGKSYFRSLLPTYDAKSGKLINNISDKQNVAIEGEDYVAEDKLSGTFMFGLRYYSKEADGTTDRKEPFFRWELLEEVDVASEREEALFNAKLAAMKKAAKKSSKVTEDELTDSWGD